VFYLTLVLDKSTANVSSSWPSIWNSFKADLGYREQDVQEPSCDGYHSLGTIEACRLADRDRMKRTIPKVVD
jgi:hypothetical protein